MHRRPAPLFATMVLAWMAAAGCVPVEGDGNADVVGGADATFDALRPDSADATWPPAVEVRTETAPIGPDGGVLDLFDGELVIKFPPDGLDQALELEVTRDLLTADGEERVGYTFGDHGYPVDPHATVVLSVPADWLPPGAATSDTLGLYHVADDLITGPLILEDVRVDAGRVTFTAGLSALNAFVIAAP